MSAIRLKSQKASGIGEKEKSLEKELFRKVQNGDSYAFRTIYDHYIGYVAAIAYRMTGNKRDMEEICQEIFIKLWEKRNQYEGKSSFKTWFHKLIVNTILDHLRSVTSHKRLVPFDLVQIEKSHSVADTENFLIIEDALLRLPVRERFILILHDVNGWKHNEIAEILGISPNTSKVHLHHARKKLREILS